jgi:uncharacterized protein YfdQ (DUF2303 family)
VNEQLEAIAAGGNDLATLFEEAAARPPDVEWSETLRGVGTRAVRNDYMESVVDLEEFFEHPRRRVANVVLQSTESFIAYARRFDFDGPTGNSDSNPTSPTVYVNRVTPAAALIIDDHCENHPGWRSHRATLAWQRTPEWKRWLANDRKALDQESFAEMIEDGLEEIVTPDAAELLEIAQTIRGTLNADITAARYLKDGTININWNETLDVKGGREGNLSIPTRFVIRVQLFEDGTPIEIGARLRLGFRNRVLTLAYLLDRPKDREIDALNAEVQLIRAGVSPSTLVVLGHPG